MADVKWIKITTDIFDDEKILLIESLPSADSIIVIWFKLLAFAGKQNNHGVFLMSNRIAYTDEMLASIFRRDVNIVRLALKAFEEYGMIEIVENVITIPNWNKHQSLDVYEKKKERDRLYQAERRSKQKALIEKSSDNRLTSSDTSSYVAVSDIDKEEEKEEEKKNKKKSKKEEALDLLNSLLSESYLSKDVKDKMVEWISYKAEIKDFYTETGLKALLRKVYDRCKTFGDTAVMEVIDDSMSSNYKGIIFDRLNGRKTSPVTPRQEKPQNSTDAFFADLQELYDEEC